MPNTNRTVVKIHLVKRGMTGLLHLPMKHVHTNLEIDILEPDTGSVNVRDLIKACLQQAKRIPSLRNLFQIFGETNLMEWQLRYQHHKLREKRQPHYPISETNCGENSRLLFHYRAAQTHPCVRPIHLPRHPPRHRRWTHKRTSTSGAPTHGRLHHQTGWMPTLNTPRPSMALTGVPRLLPGPTGSRPPRPGARNRTRVPR